LEKLNATLGHIERNKLPTLLMTTVVERTHSMSTVFKCQSCFDVNDPFKSEYSIKIIGQDPGNFKSRKKLPSCCFLE
jgi:hypothetical protein